MQENGAPAPVAPIRASDALRKKLAKIGLHSAVSYTHLTLPTIYSV